MIDTFVPQSKYMYAILDSFHLIRFRRAETSDDTIHTQHPRSADRWTRLNGCL